MLTVLKVRVGNQETIWHTGGKGARKAELEGQVAFSYSLIIFG